MSNDDLSYYRHRAETESNLATRAAHPEAAAAHTQLATAYLKRLSSVGDKTRLDHA